MEVAEAEEAEVEVEEVDMADVVLPILIDELRSGVVESLIFGHPALSRLNGSPTGHPQVFQKLLQILDDFLQRI